MKGRQLVRKNDSKTNPMQLPVSYHNKTRDGFFSKKEKSERGFSSISLEESERFYFNEYLMAAIQQFVVIAFLCFFFLYLFGP